MKALLIVCLLFAAPAFALVLDEPLPDSVQEAHARELFHDFRCVVCQSESLAESPAEVAREIRRTIRERVASGGTDEAIRHYLVGQYGQTILMRPDFAPDTYLLWLGPLCIFCVSAAALIAYFGAGRIQKRG
jgi:cytochrome c-type biogenesis protein CcmH